MDFPKTRRTDETLYEHAHNPDTPPTAGAGMSYVQYKVTSYDLKLALLQYFRFKRQWVCVDEFDAMDIAVDTGKEIIEVEVKMTKGDLIHGEAKKEANRSKHYWYTRPNPGPYKPNKFMLCVPEFLVDTAKRWVNEINIGYGIIACDTERIARIQETHYCHWWREQLRIAKHAKQLHANYSDTLKWGIAKRASSKLTKLMCQGTRKPVPPRKEGE